MSSANITLVREIYAAWEQGDFAQTDWADRDLEFAMPGSFEGAEVHRGVEGMRRAWRNWLSAWKDFSVRAEEYSEHGDQVLVLARFSGRGKHSGLDVDNRLHASVFTIRGGKVVRLEADLDAERALAKLGLGSG